jgi:hypothetical protein
MLTRYLEGWADADPVKIADATTDDYDFHDPLVGHFSRSTLPRYFMLLRSRFAMAGVSSMEDLEFRLHGPMSSAAPHSARCQYWREARHLGLTGIAELAVRDGRVVAEVVAYDLNMASETLRVVVPIELAPARVIRGGSRRTPTRAAGWSNTWQRNHPYPDSDSH